MKKILFIFLVLLSVLVLVVCILKDSNIYCIYISGIVKLNLYFE